jgi:hypothetical protein
MSRLSGISGSLFPHRYLTDAMHAVAPPLPAPVVARQQRHFRRWWHGVAAACGPATGLRALFDLVAMPLFGLLGFRAHDAVFERHQARAWLATRQATPVGLVLLPWAERPSALWRDLVSTARDIGARWTFLLAPPYLSLVDARGHATRRGIEFTLPDVLEPPAFTRFWWLARAEAFDPMPERGEPSRAWIDSLVDHAAIFQDRVREDLQHGVADALRSLGGAIAVAHRSRPAPGRLTSTSGRVAIRLSPFDEALTIVYRILFLLFAESRSLVPAEAPIYAGAYAIGALGRAARAQGGPPGLWEALAAITRLSRSGCRTDDLIVRPFNGRLFSRAAAPSLEAGRRVSRRLPAIAALDAAAGHALVALASRKGPAGREDIHYADLGVEQLGSVYERVLDLDESTPDAALPRSEPSASGRRPRHSARRKQTGTFYTPRPLAEFLVRRTLAPLVAGASADAILTLRILDPAMGSGAFLVAACRFLAAAYERALIDEGRVTPAHLDEDERADIRRLIAERCLAGVDQNPVAVQLARLSLWLATLAHGKPLSFLDHRLRVGNSLIGASPADLTRIPARGPSSRPASLPLFDDGALESSMRRAAVPLAAIASRRDDNVADVRAKEALWTHLTSRDSPLAPWRQAAMVWCARWFWPTTDVPPNPAECRALLDAVLRADRTLPAGQVASRLNAAAEAGRRHGFFHWPLEFMDVFYNRDGQPRDRAGFDAIIGNPPWEMIRQGPEADDSRPVGDRRGLVRFVRESGLYPSCDRGHLNLYQPFLERSMALVRPGGRIGLVLPWGLAADDGSARLRQRLLDETAVDTIVGLDNSAALFPIHRGLRFLVLMSTMGRRTQRIRARFGVRMAAELDGLPGRMEEAEDHPFPVTLTPGLIRRIGGSTARLPDVRRPADLELVERLATRFPAMGSASGWNVAFGRELNATDDRDHFGPQGLPVLEGKHITPFQTDLTAPTYHVDRARARQLLPDAPFDRPRLGYRDVSGVGNRLSLIAAIIPAGALTTHTIFCLRSTVALEAQQFLCGLFNSYVLNAIVRMLMGGHLTTSLVEGLPAPRWTMDARQRRIAGLSTRLGHSGRSARLNAVLQAEVAQLYELDEEEFRRVLEAFPLVPASERDMAARAFADGAREMDRPV